MLKNRIALLITCIFIAFSSSCTLNQNTSPNPLLSDPAARLLLYPENPNDPLYSIGEYIGFDLQIVNNDKVPIEFHEFAFDGIRLAFSSPNAAHLIGPDGQDLLLPYERFDTPYDYGSPVQVPPNSEEWSELVISNYLQLRQPGQYVFWLELTDNFGKMYKSNSVSFQLMDIEPSVSPDLIELTLSIPSQNKALFFLERIAEVTFTNNSGVPLTFLTPQDGSESAWVSPVYQFVIVDSSGRSLAMPPSDVHGKPVYDETTQFTIPPGGSYRQQIGVPNYLEVQKPGEYQVRLTYLVRKHASSMGFVLDDLMDWDENVFIGRLESNQIKIVLEN